MTHEMLVDAKTDREPVKGIALKGTIDEDEEDDITMMAKRFEKHFRNQRKFMKGKNSSKTNSSNAGCFKCGEVGHLIKNCPKWKDRQSMKNKK